MEFANILIERLQRTLDFGGCTAPQFANKKSLGRIGVTGCAIGAVGGLHLGVIVTLPIIVLMSPPSSWSIFLQALACWCTYMILLCGFHFLEFFITALSQPSTLSFDSFIVSHSKAYTIAALASWTEFWLEYIIIGRFKFRLWVTVLGVSLTIAGQVVRTAAMLHCGENFSHLIMNERKDDHQLVTTGIYRRLRHPSYFGWFYWAVGTQLILCNPICTIMYTAAAWMFFKDRVAYEERTLLHFYGTQYAEYAQQSFIGIPFITSPALNRKSD